MWVVELVGVGRPGDWHEGGVEWGVDMEVVGEKVVVDGGEEMDCLEGVRGDDGGVKEAAEVGVG